MHQCNHRGCIDQAIKGSPYCAGHASAQEKRELEAVVGKGPHPENTNSGWVSPEAVAAFNKQTQSTCIVMTEPKKESSGGDNDYWVANITEPKRLAPYKAEAEDLIELFQFSFAEGNAFKALWRMGMDRVATGKPGDTPLRNAEKVAYYGSRMVKAEQKKLK
jgi:hypothetical protein